VYADLNGDKFRCTFIQTDEEHVLTSSHCFDEPIEGASCNQEAVFYYTDGEKLECDRITKIDGNIMQIKLLQPTKSFRTPYINSVLQDGQLLHVWKVDSANNKLALTKEVCSFHTNNILTYENVDGKSSDLTLADCNLISGNSGAPILTNENRLAGIVEYMFPLQNIRAAAPPLLSHSRLQFKTPIGVASYIHCFTYDHVLCDPLHTNSELDYVMSSVSKEITDKMINSIPQTGRTGVEGTWSLRNKLNINEKKNLVFIYSETLRNGEPKRVECDLHFVLNEKFQPQESIVSDCFLF